MTARPNRQACARAVLTLPALVLAMALAAGASAQCPAEGSCCVVHPNPGCDDGPCCSAVCALDPFCCVEDWDEECVRAAGDLCKDCVPPPDADTCADAVEILDGTTEFSNAGAQTDEPPASCAAIGADIWFTYVPGCDGTLTVSTCGTVDYDSFLVAYSGTCGALVEIACNDDGPGCPGFSSEMSVPVTGDEQIYIRVGGFQGAEGSGTVSITPIPPCNCPGEGDCCSANGSVGCDDDDCCQAVCTLDPFCCTVEWDASCASAALFVCGACGGAPSGQPLALDFNWNGLVHAGEAGTPDAPNGYRSISDRGLVIGSADSLGGTTGTVDALLDYALTTEAGLLDTMYIGGPRSNGVDIGFDDVEDGDNIGVPPNWDPSGGTSGVDVATSKIAPIDVTEAFALGVLYNASVNGGTFDLTLGFASGLEVTVTIGVPDWFANFDGAAPPPEPGVAFISVLQGPLSGGDGFLSTALSDAASPGEPLNALEAVMTYGSLLEVGPPLAGEQLTSLTIDNAVAAVNPAMTVGLYAATVANGGDGEPCPADVDGTGTVDVADLVEVILQWGPCGSECTADVDGSGVVDVADLVEVILQWGPCP